MTDILLTTSIPMFWENSCFYGLKWVVILPFPIYISAIEITKIFQAFDLEPIYFDLNLNVIPDCFILIL